MLEKFWKKKLGKSVGSAVLFKHNTDQQSHNMNHSLNRKTHNLLCVYIFLFTEQCPRIRNQPVVAHSSWTALPLHFSRPRRSVLAEGATLIPGPCVFPYIQLAAQTASWETTPAHTWSPFWAELASTHKWGIQCDFSHSCPVMLQSGRLHLGPPSFLASSPKLRMAAQAKH